MKKRVFFAAVVGAAIILSLLHTNSAGAIAHSQRVIVPAYTHPKPAGEPDPYWSTLNTLFKKDQGKTVPMAIINVNDGPGDKADPNYARQLADNTNNGIRNIAYIRTGNHTKPLTEVKAEITRWLSFYRNTISGIMLDEVVATQPDQIAYLKDIHDYIRKTYPYFVIIANPGGHISDAAAPYADIFVTSSTSAIRYLGADYTPATSVFETSDDTIERNFHIIYDATPSQYPAIIKKSRERNAGYVFITNAAMPAPFTALPKEFDRAITLATAGSPNPKAYVLPGSLETSPKPAPAQPQQDTKPQQHNPQTSPASQNQTATATSTSNQNPHTQELNHDQHKPNSDLAETGSNAIILAGAIITMIGIGLLLTACNAYRQRSRR